MDVRFCMGRNHTPRGTVAPRGILIRSSARSPERGQRPRAFPLTLTYMDVGYPDISTRLLETSGFAAGFISGAGISEAGLGWADQGVMGLEENLRACRAFVACCELPLMADGDTGYGNAVNVHFTMRAFEQVALPVRAARRHFGETNLGQKDK